MPADRIDIRGLRPGAVELLAALAAERRCSIESLLRPRIEAWLSSVIAADRGDLPAAAVRQFEASAPSRRPRHSAGLQELSGARLPYRD